MTPAGRRSQRGQVHRPDTWHSLLLVAPMFAFLAITFLAPIGRMLWRGIEDPELIAAMPATAAALRAWDGHDLPSPKVFATLADDMPRALADRSLAVAAQRLNNDLAGMRGLMLGTARRLPDKPDRDTDVDPNDNARADADAGWRAALIRLDPRWAEPATWTALRRASFGHTDLYLLGAIDLDRDAAGRIVAVPANEAVFRDVLARTLGISASVTLFCLILGFPIAYLLASVRPALAGPLMILVLLPFWTSLLVRTSAWVVLLQKEGLVNGLLGRLGLIEAPLPLIFNRFAVLVAMTHVLLPFMVLPLYSVMRGIPPALMRAAASLGAPPWRAFVRVYLPQAAPGIAAGCLLVFILALGYYITPALVGGADDQMVSYFIAFYTNRSVNWGLAAALSALLLLATGVLYAVYARLAGGIRLG